MVECRSKRADAASKGPGRDSKQPRHIEQPDMFDATVRHAWILVGPVIHAASA